MDKLFLGPQSSPALFQANHLFVRVMFLGQEGFVQNFLSRTEGLDLIGLPLGDKLCDALNVFVGKKRFDHGRPEFMREARGDDEVNAVFDFLRVERGPDNLFIFRYRGLDVHRDIIDELLFNEFPKDTGMTAVGVELDCVAEVFDFVQEAVQAMLLGGLSAGDDDTVEVIAPHFQK